MSGRIDYDNDDGSASAVFSEEATPSGSGLSHFYEFSRSVVFSESPLHPPPTESAAYSSSSYAIPATVILVSIAALLLLAGGLKVCGHIRQSRRRRQSYMYTHADGNPLPLNIKSIKTSGYETCPHGYTHTRWSMLPLEEHHQVTRTGQQPSLREAVRIADAMDAADAENEEIVGESKTTSLTSLDSSTCGDVNTRTPSLTTVAVEVELHPQDR